MLLFIEVFVIIFFIVLLVYEGIVFRKYRSDKKKECPKEVMILVNLYKVDVKKISYRNLLHVVAVVSSLDIAFIVSVASIIKDGILQIIVGFILIFPVILFSYYLVSLYYNKIKK